MFNTDTLDADTSYIRLSQSFLYAVRTGNSIDNYMQLFKTADKEKLQQQLTTDSLKKAFWLNIYNAFVQKILTENPERYKSRNSFFSDKQIMIAATPLSLDDIEHGLLRRSKVKWSFGYLTKLFPSDFEKVFRVKNLDNRIHFALNCGAKSCPPIAYYDPENIEKQLDVAAENYLKEETEYDTLSGSVYLPKIMSWFRADFGGAKGIRNMLTKYQALKNTDAKIRFKKYHWGIYLNNYRTDAGTSELKDLK